MSSNSVCLHKTSLLQTATLFFPVNFYRKAYKKTHGKTVFGAITDFVSERVLSESWTKKGDKRMEKRGLRRRHCEGDGIAAAAGSGERWAVKTYFKDTTRLPPARAYPHFERTVDMRAIKWSLEGGCNAIWQIKWSFQAQQVCIS